MRQRERGTHRRHSMHAPRMIAGAGATDSTADMLRLMSCSSSSSSSLLTSSLLTSLSTRVQGWVAAAAAGREDGRESDAEGERFGSGFGGSSIYIGLTDGARQLEAIYRRHAQFFSSFTHSLSSRGSWSFPGVPMKNKINKNKKFLHRFLIGFLIALLRLYTIRNESSKRVQTH